MNSFAVRSDLFLLKHPFYRAWMEGKLRRETLKEYAAQYYHHVAAFPSYLREAMDHCPEGPWKAVLSENLAEEEGVTHGTPHPELWLRFAEGLGATREEVLNSKKKPGIQRVINTFSGYAKASLGEALGSLYAYESQVPEVAQSKIEGLKTNYGIHDERTLAFFEVHRVADIEHRESLLKVLRDLPEASRKNAEVARDRSAQALWDFLTEMTPIHI